MAVSAATTVKVCFCSRRSRPQSPQNFHADSLIELQVLHPGSFMAMPPSMKCVNGGKFLLPPCPTGAIMSP